ncbi:hypothetical protein H9Q70_004045 [Fusarium xylarioides]|nr:hypothetical protein H9Q70_004045 [Fusarium xylarioides]
MDTSQRSSVSDSQLGKQSAINQGNVHGNFTINYTSPHSQYPPARPEIVRVIPYPRNEDSVHRKHLVDKLNELLPPTQGPGSAALWGLGGTGKTQIALHYAYQRCIDDEKCCVFWVHADSAANFTSDYMKIAKELGIEEQLSGPELLDAVRRGIESRPKWLLIIDNADNLGIFGIDCLEEKSNLFKYVPHGRQGTVLWTSRDEHIVGTLVGALRGIQVGPMATIEAASLLATSRGISLTSVSPEIYGLIDELEYLPLVISQAGAFMRRMSLSPEEYLHLLKKRSTRWEVLGISDIDRHRRPEVSNSILETWSISTERIAAESKMSYHLLHIIAYVDHQDIPEALLAEAAAQFQRGEGVTEMQLLSAIRRLRELCFVSLRQTREIGRSYEMHKLVQEALRYRLNTNDQRSITRASTITAQSDWQSLEYTGTRCSMLALNLMSRLFPEPEPNLWVQCELFTSHAIRVSEWVEVNKSQIETARLLKRVSSFLYDRGRWKETEPLLNRVLTLQQGKLGAKHPDTLDTQQSLVWTYYSLELIEKARNLQRKILEIQREILGERHPDTINSMSYLVVMSDRDDISADDEESFQGLLELQRQVHGQKSMPVIRTMIALAQLHIKQDLYQDAETLLQEVTEIRKARVEETESETIWTSSTLALTWNRLGRYEEAERLLKQALELRRKLLGNTHPKTILTSYDFAVVYYNQGRYKEAEPFAQSAYDMFRQVLGSEHGSTLRAQNVLTKIHKASMRSKTI